MNYIPYISLGFIIYIIFIYQVCTNAKTYTNIYNTCYIYYEPALINIYSVVKKRFI